MESYLENLNEGQVKAVQTTDGPVMILAGAGSGKTRTLVTRIIHLLQYKRVKAYELLALTFSNKAAKEMRERIGKSLGVDNRSLMVTTFHSFCARVLRTEYKELGLAKNFSIYDASESKSIVKTLMKKRGIDQKKTSPYEFMYYIENLKNNGHYLGKEDDDFPIDKEDSFYDFYVDYENELKNSDAVDFGSLICSTLQIFEKNPAILERYAKRFKYLLVDEYQDTNRSQFLLINLLSSIHGNLCVVGDEDQSIYSWRGADIRNILDFEKFYPKYELIHLEQNYRSSKTIIDAASALISKNMQRKGKNMWTNNVEGESVKIYECLNDKVEAFFIVHQIKQKVENGHKLDDIAVFYRTNSQSRIIEDYLRMADIPYKIVGGIKFYDRAEIKDVLSYLKASLNPNDSLSLMRVINKPARGIGKTTVAKLEKIAIERNISISGAIEILSENPEVGKSFKISKKVTDRLEALLQILKSIFVMDQSEEYSAYDCFMEIINKSGYLEKLENDKSYESMAKVENIQELGSALKQFCYDNPGAHVGEFLEELSLDQNKIEESTDGPRDELVLMTVHSAKGLEYPVVFIAGNEEYLFPSYQSIEQGEVGLEEERRLFYVAMTRAMKELYITYALGRMQYGSMKYNPPSRFLTEIPSEYNSWFRVGEGSVEEISQRDGKQREELREQTDQYTGKIIEHQLYGRGQIIEVKGSGEEQKVIIKFKTGEKKKFLLKYAPIHFLG